MSISLRWLFAALFLLCFGLALLPGLPIHGYGHLWWGLPLLYWFREPRQRRRLLLYALGIVLQVLAYPDVDRGWLGWVLLLPYLLAREQEDGAHWFRAAFLYGFLRAHVGFFWLGGIHFVAWISVSLLLALYFALLFEGALRLLRFLPYALRVGTAWLLFELGHATILGGFPWLFLAHTQYAFPRVMQCVDLIGPFGLTFVLAFVQTALLAAYRKRGWVEAGVGLLLVAAVLAYGGRSPPAVSGGSGAGRCSSSRPITPTR